MCCLAVTGRASEIPFVKAIFEEVGMLFLLYLGLNANLNKTESHAPANLEEGLLSKVRPVGSHRPRDSHPNEATDFNGKRMAWPRPMGPMTKNARTITGRPVVTKDDRIFSEYVMRTCILKII